MTTVSRRIDTAMKHIADKDYENALIQISIAIDATAKKKWPNLNVGGKGEVGARIRKFIEQYEPFIYQIASAGHLTLGIGAHVAVPGGKELPEIIYKMVRCQQLHGGELEDNIVIKDGFNIFGVENGKIIINTGHIYGLLLSVVVDPVNNVESCESNPVLNHNGTDTVINELWGNINNFKNYRSFGFGFCRLADTCRAR